MSDADEAILQEIRTMNALLKLTSHEAVRQLIVSELSAEKTMRVYQASDGATPQAKVARKAGVNQATVSRLWQRWKALGLAVEGDSGRARALFEPGAYGVATGRQTGAQRG